MYRLVPALIIVLLWISTGWAKMIHFITIDYYNPTTESVETLRGTTYAHGWTDSEGNLWHPAILEGVSMGQQLFSGSTMGHVATDLGMVRWANPGGAFDYLRACGFDARAVTISCAPSVGATRKTWWRGTCEQIEMGWTEIAFRLRSRDFELDRPLKRVAYTDEDTAVDNKYPPLVLGGAKNVQLLCIDEAHNIWAVQGPIEGVDAVYDKGVALGGNLFENPGFDEDRYWNTNSVFGGSDWRIVDGELKIIDEWVTGTADCPYTFPTGLAVQENFQYTLSFDVLHEDGNSGTGRWLAGEFITTEGITFSFQGNGRYTKTFTVDEVSPPPEPGGYYPHINMYYNTFRGSIDNISLIPVAVDHPDRASLEAAPIHPGGYHTCLAEGLVKLGSPAEGTVTADVRGYTSGTYTDTLPGVLQLLLTDFGGFTVDDLDTAAWAALESACDYPVSTYIGPAENPTTAEMLSRLAASARVWTAWTATGKLTCGQIADPALGSTVATLSLDHADKSSIAKLATSDPGRGVTAKKITVHAQKNHTVQIGDLVTESTAFTGDLVGAVSKARQQWLAAQFRQWMASDPDVETVHPNAPEIEVETCLEDAADAQAEADALKALYCAHRDLWEAAWPPKFLKDADGAPTVKLGDVVELVCNRFDLAAGKNFLVCGMHEQAARGSRDPDLVTLTLWG